MTTIDSILPEQDLLEYLKQLVQNFYERSKEIPIFCSIDGEEKKGMSEVRFILKEIPRI